MRDSQELMIRFTKIVERHPEIYDHNMDAYKTRQVDTAWEKVAASVRTELQEECSVEELKIKWKGIRSSFNRYKNKLLNPNQTGSCKKYYLYESLKYLDPFTKPKGPQLKDSTYEEMPLFDEGSNENNSSEGWTVAETKPDISGRPINQDPLIHQRLFNIATGEYSENAKKRKYSGEDKNTDEDNEDLQFFKSILPDIRDFTNKEKRKLKMGILNLIDELENERKQK